MAMILFLLLLFVPAATSAQPDPLSFADSLAEQQDHYRAITEYKRFLHHYPADSRAAYAQLAIAKSLLAGERWAEADRALEEVWGTYPASDEASEAKRLYAQAPYERGDYPLSRLRYLELRQSPDCDDCREIDYRIGLIALHLGQVVEARESFMRITPPLNEQLALSLEEYQRLPRKSPRLAGAFSALLPGAGQLYTGHPRQAGIAFALNAAFIYGAVEAWNNQNHAVAGILSLFEIGWYGGNIYNAMNNAHKFNQRQEHQFLDHFRKRFGCHFGLGQNQLQLQARFHF